MAPLISLTEPSLLKKVSIKEQSYPFTDPAVSPEIILRWKITTNITNGRVTNTLAAIVNP